MSQSGISNPAGGLWQAKIWDEPLPLLALSVLLLSRIWANYSFPLFDDALITFRYAENLCKGDGLVYNPGEWVLGTTAPLYSLILSSTCMLGIPTGYSSAAIGILSDVIVGILVFPVISRSFSYRAGTVFLLIFSLSPMLNLIGASGMESSFFLLMLVVALLSYTRGHPVAAVLVGTAAYFVRPEAVLLLFLFGFVELTTGRFLKALSLMAVSLAVAVPALLLMYAFYGAIVPHSVIAKAATTGGTVRDVARTLLWPDWFTTLTLPIAAVGALPCLRRPGFTRLLLLFAAVYVAAYFGRRPFMWPWYGTPVILATTIAAGIGADIILQRVPHFGRWLNSVRIQLAAPVLMLVSFALIQYRHSGHDVTRNLYAPLAEWCAHNFQPIGAVLASDIGAVGYFCGGRVLDAAALVWPEALKYSSALDIIKDHRPEFLFLNVTEDSKTLLPALDGINKYEIVGRFSSTGLQETDPSKIEWSGVWVQDYLMLRGSR